MTQPAGGGPATTAGADVKDGAEGVSRGIEKKDWAWRRRLRSNPKTRGIYRAFVGVLGTLVCLLGLVLIPAPGPGWVVVFLGLGILASEYAWAAAALAFARARVGAWTDWAARQPLAVRGLLGLATCALLVAIFWLLFRVTGVPGFVPASWVPSWSGLGANR